ncbi:hypothetical protein FOZ60_004178 [Perkinsus olseni]|uniref:Uncharacterized protein n=1 Tax=Perkinsus olseni TaxID=32597 RepID=A0A7J6NUM2_PEROL|nr:hypothetical protein FOZ60_004178 [Perkinsus olseni]
MTKPVATWFIAATLALVTASVPFIGEYELLTTSVRVHARFSDGFVSFFCEAAVEPEYSASVEHIRLVGGPGPDTYTVDLEWTGTELLPVVQIQDGDLTTLNDYHPLLFKTRFEGKEVTFFRKGLPLTSGTYVYSEGPNFSLNVTVAASEVDMNVLCSDGGLKKQFTSTLGHVIHGELTNALFGGGAGYTNFIDDVATGCSKSDLPRGSDIFFLFLATDDTLYLQLDGLPPTTYALVRNE